MCQWASWPLHTDASALYKTRQRLRDRGEANKYLSFKFRIFDDSEKKSCITHPVPALRHGSSVSVLPEDEEEEEEEEEGADEQPGLSCFTGLGPGEYSLEDGELDAGCCRVFVCSAPL